MAVFVNWFEVKFAKMEAILPCRTFPSWAQANEYLDAHGRPPFVGGKPIAGEQGELLILINGDPPPEGFESRSFDLQMERGVGSRIISMSLSKHLNDRGCRVRTEKFGSYATTEQFRISDIGFSVRAGVSFKPHYIGYKSAVGITLNWHTEQEFYANVADMRSIPTDEFKGLPVIWKGEGIDDFLIEKDGRYIGIILSVDGENANIRCRDQQIRTVPTEHIVLEARKDVLSRIAAFSKDAGSVAKLEKRMAVLSLAEKSGGGKNVSILRDRLKSAIEFLCPSGQAALLIDLEPNLNARMRIEMVPSIAEMATNVQR